MILSGQAIRERLGSDIVIDPFDEAQLNPNSYNLTLHDELLTYEEVVLDMAEPNRTRRIKIPPQGLVLDPFLGSGTTALAAELEGFPWIGIEREAEYVAIAEARLNGTQRGLGLEA